MQYDVQTLRCANAAEAQCRAASVAVLAAFGAIITSPSPTLAQSAFTLPAPPFEVPFLPSASGDWTMTIGAGAEYKPNFDGAKGGKFSPVPIFSIHRAGTAEQFRGPRDGANIALIDFGNLKVGPAGKFVSARKAGSHPELSGLGDVDTTFELGGFIQYFPVDWFRLRNETRQGIGGHDGIVSDFSADFIVPITRGFTISAGPRFTLESAKAIAPYFSINSAQAVATGLSVFDAKGGAHSAGVGAQISYRIDQHWEVHSYVEYERLLGDAAKSPLVTVRGSVNQTTVGIGASYSFDFKIR
jgi:outer membrane protein